MRAVRNRPSLPVMESPSSSSAGETSPNSMTREARPSDLPTAVPEAEAVPDEHETLRQLLLSRRYELLDLIATGGMGAVYRARHLLLDRIVAAKFLTLETSQMRGLFVNEGRALASLRHPNVVEVFDLDEVEGVPFLIMELLEGESLDERLRRVGRLPVDEACGIMKQMLAGLGAAHERGIIHRDVKPANVFIEALSGGRERVKLIDFGICAESGVTALRAGTPHYQAPEQLGGSPHDPHTDLWAIGVTLYQMLTGELPFRGDDAEALQRAVLFDAPRRPSEIVETLSPEIDSTILRLLSKAPADRFDDVSEVLSACSKALAGEVALTVSAPTEYAIIADGNAARAAVTRTVLADLGFLGIIAADGIEATELLRDIGPPKIAVVDLTLSRHDGFRFIKELRRVANGKETAVVATSAIPAFLEVAMASAELGVGAAVVAGEITALRQAIESSLLTVPVPPPAVVGRRSPITDPSRVRAVTRVSSLFGAPSSKSLRGLVDDVARYFHVPIALVSLVLDDRPWFEAHVGLSGELLENRGTPIEQSFCRHVVVSGEPLVVDDAREHPAFRDNSLVRRGIVTSYVGAPISTEAGKTLGTLCLIDSIPRSFGPHDVADLAALARRVGGELEVRARGAERDTEEGDEEAGGESNIDPNEASVEIDESHHVVAVTASFVALFGIDPSAVIGTDRKEFVARLATLFDSPEEFVERTRVARGGPFMSHAVFRLKAPRATELQWLAKPFIAASGRFRVREVFTRIG